MEKLLLFVIDAEQWAVRRQSPNTAADLNCTVQRAHEHLITSTVPLSFRESRPCHCFLPLRSVMWENGFIDESKAILVSARFFLPMIAHGTLGPKEPMYEVGFQLGPAGLL